MLYHNYSSLPKILLKYFYQKNTSLFYILHTSLQLMFIVSVNDCLSLFDKISFNFYPDRIPSIAKIVLKVKYKQVKRDQLDQKRETT